MKRTLAVATIAIICAAGHPIATAVEMQLTARGPGFALTQAGQNSGNVWNGSWQGTTVSGHPLVLEIQVQAQRMTGRLIVGKQSAKITEAKVAGIAFAFITGPIDGHKVAGTGRQVGDAIELSIDGVKQPLMLTRMKSAK